MGSFLAQRVLLHQLGLDVLGLNGLLTNLVAMLSIAELGLGPAMIFRLYRPLEEHNLDLVKSLLRFYRNGYRLIALVVLFVGAIVLAVLPTAVTDPPVGISIYFAFALFLLDTVLSYLMSYKRSILYADRKNYLINLVMSASFLVTTGLQVAVLYLTASYYLFLTIRIITRVAENIILNRITDNLYSEVTSGTAEKLPSSESKAIFQQLHGLIYHRVSSFVVLGSDNIIISFFLGLESVGRYTNYYMLYQALNKIVTQAFESIKSSIGHRLLSRDSAQERFADFRLLFLCSTLIASVASSGLLTCSRSLITLWLGQEYVLQSTFVAPLSALLFITIMRGPYHQFKEASGVFYADRFMPVIELTLNIGSVVILVQVMGLPGVVWGNFISTLFLFSYPYVHFVYAPLFARSAMQHFGELAYAITVGSVGALSSLAVCTLFVEGTGPGALIIQMLVSAALPTVFFIAFYFRTLSEIARKLRDGRG